MLSEVTGCIELTKNIFMVPEPKLTKSRRTVPLGSN